MVGVESRGQPPFKHTAEGADTLSRGCRTKKRSTNKESSLRFSYIYIYLYFREWMSARRKKNDPIMKDSGYILNEAAILIPFGC